MPQHSTFPLENEWAVEEVFFSQYKMKGIEALAPAIGKLASSILGGLWNLFKESWLILWKKSLV